MKKTTIQSKNPSKKNRTGATIVETIVALVIFATFITGAAKVLMSQRQLKDKARAHYTAINIAKNRIELVRNMRASDYQQILSMTEPAPGVIVDEDGIPPDNASAGKFRRTTTITPSINNNYRLEIEVEVKIKSPITLRFEGENEHLKSYMAQLL